MKLSILIPVFNEEKTIRHLLESVLQVEIPKTRIEIIIVNDASTDNTEEEIEKVIGKNRNIHFISHTKNMGKGAAIKTAMRHATGDYFIIQDADLEYHPRQIKSLVEAIGPKDKTIIYGTRLNRLPHLTKEEKNGLFLLHFFGNRFLSLVTSLLYGQWLTDMETCYKLFPKTALHNVKLHAKGFEFEPEITVKFLKRRYSIKEIPITTTPRGYKDGKKLHTIRDGTKALWTILKYRFVD